MKRIGILFITFITLILFIGCGKPVSNENKKLIIETETNSSDKSSTGTDKKTIALIMKTLTNPFFIEMEKGARNAEKEFNINLIVKTGAKETSIEQQIAIVDEMISKNVDAIVIAPGSSSELIPVLKKAQDAGIPIVNIDNRLDPELCKKLGLDGVPFISVDNEEGAYISAKYISDQIKNHTEVAILEGIREADNAEQRKNGALRAFNENKNIKVVSSETANWKIDEAYDVAAKIFAKNPGLSAVFCANDMMALGVIQYLDKYGKKDIMVAGFDALDEAKKAIKDGKMEVTINQQADIQGYTGVKYAVEMIQGKKVPSETMVDVKAVNKENIN